MALAPSPSANYVGPPVASDTQSPWFPKWMYHPTLAPVLVMDDTQEGVLQVSSSSWTETRTT